MLENEGYNRKICVLGVAGEDPKQSNLLTNVIKCV